MGPQPNWLKSILPSKNPNPNELVGLGGEKRSSRKWKLLWRRSCNGEKEGGGGSGASDYGLRDGDDDVFSAAMATLIRATHKDFLIVRREWAAVRIQAVFRGFLARRALRALKALVRLQAIVRGRLVRKKAAVTLRCMQSLVRVQAQVRARQLRMSSDEQSDLRSTNKNQDYIHLLKREKGEWCDIRGSVKEAKTKPEMKQVGDARRERAAAYSISQQRFRSSPNPIPGNVMLHYAQTSRKPEGNGVEQSWLDHWMPNKPWENRLMEVQSDVPYKSPLSRTYPQQVKANARSLRKFQHDSMRVMSRTGVPKSSLKPSLNSRNFAGSCSESASQVLNDDSPTSTWSSPTQVSSNTELTDDSVSKPRYMKFTASNKAKQRAGKHSSFQANQRKDVLSVKKSAPWSSSELRSSADSTQSSSHHQYLDLYPPLNLNGYH